MPYENPAPGIYWGYRCEKCDEVIALWPYTEGSYWRGSGGFTLDCVDWYCQFQAEYSLANIHPIVVPPVAELLVA
ncbi:MAG TPA: hypothetical protein VE969_11460 [Pyrinomonadaceae bacterium]|jgi:hypothetical protein|nr:hypothetical protein [Pyrinomonadaceae bacterium]